MIWYFIIVFGLELKRKYKTLWINTTDKIITNITYTLHHYKKEQTLEEWLQI